MSIPIKCTRSLFYAELTPQKQAEYFSLTEKKFLHDIDNFYYSVFITGDNIDIETTAKLQPLLDNLLEVKERVKELKHPEIFTHDLLLMPTGIKGFDIHLSEPDLYDIFITSSPKLRNINTNRIQVQLRSEGIHTRAISSMLSDSLDKIKLILADYGLTIAKVQENRIDYCYHTNIRSSVHDIFETSGDVKFLKTQLTKGDDVFTVETGEDGTFLSRNYYLFGRRKSNNYLVRLYDKVREVIENGYKGFFFKLWYDQGLISYYDKWCFEYAIHFKSLKHLALARIAFYVAHGKNPVLVTEYKNALADKNKSLADYHKLAKGFMPSNTNVINIEFQTMRGFYIRSDNHINTLPTQERDCDPMLKRFYQILDNRELFLNYLHGDGFSFKNGLKEDGTPNYLSWWERLRNTKVGGFKADENLIREYSYMLNKSVVSRRLMNNHASLACYEDELDTDIYQDVQNSIEHITDNIIHNLFEQYGVDKQRKNRQIKNRKKNQPLVSKQTESAEPIPEPQTTDVNEWLQWGEFVNPDAFDTHLYDLDLSAYIELFDPEL